MEVNTPPNKADQFRELTIWIPETGEHLELTCNIHEIKNAGLEEGNKVSIKIEKKLIDMASECRCDAEKFQKRTVEKIYSKEVLDSPRDSPWVNTTRDIILGL